MGRPEAKIREAFLHPEEEVRLTALSYFCSSGSQDESIMPLVIQAVETFGRDKAFRILRQADALPQTEATVRWLTGELSKDWDLNDVTNDNYCFAIALILCTARPDLLQPVMASLRCFPGELRDRFQRRLAMASWDWDAGWSAFEEFGRAVRDRGEFRLRDLRHGELIVESLAAHRNKAKVVLALLNRRYRGFERNLMEWLEYFLVGLAGRMRMEAAVPVLVERMHEDDVGLSDACTTALQRIGGDGVVEAVARQWPSGDRHFRCGAAEILGHIHTDLSVEKCLHFLAVETEEDTKDFLAVAILRNFAEEAVEPVRQMVLGSDDEMTPDRRDLRYHLTAASTVMGARFPEYEEWVTLAVGNHWGWHGMERNRIRENFQEDARDEDQDEEHWDEADWDEEDEDDSGGAFRRNALRLEPARQERERVARNAPCPCGSGKKYKKCCMKK